MPINPCLKCPRINYIKKVLKQIIGYPDKKNPRRTENGYPSELFYDDFAYERMVDSYRNALKELLKNIEEVK